MQAVLRRKDEEIYCGGASAEPARRAAGNQVSDQITLLHTVFARG
jgi:hypothetical protein